MIKVNVIKHQKVIYIVFFISVLFLASCGSSKNDPEELNAKLELLENNVYIAINDGNQKEALKLVGQLIHPSNEEMEKEKKESGFFGTNFSNDNYTYNEWWAIKRDKLRKEILLMNVDSTKIQNKKTSNLNVEDAVIDNVKDISVTLDGKYLGLYIFQTDKGNTQFYKFISNPKSSSTKVLYQDNNNGNVNIENYSIISFNKATNELIIVSKKNNSRKVKLSFKRDIDSDNGYKLYDENGQTYEFISN